MKRPGVTKPRPPGGGAAGRAQQFEAQRSPAKEVSHEPEAEESNARGSSKKVSKTRKSKPK